MLGYAEGHVGHFPRPFLAGWSGNQTIHSRNSPGINSVRDHVARHLNVAGTRSAIHACAHRLQEGQC